MMARLPDSDSCSKYFQGMAYHPKWCRIATPVSHQTSGRPSSWRPERRSPSCPRITLELILKRKQKNKLDAQILRTLVEANQTDRATQLPHVQFTINSAWNESTGFAPFELTRGYVPRTLPAPFADVSNARPPTSGEVYVELARQNCAIAADHLLSASLSLQQRQEALPRGHNKPVVGDLVWLPTKNLAVSKGTARKLAPNFVGTYRVACTWPETHTFELQLPKFLVQRTYTIEAISDS
jgi:hypothetical protein